MCAALLIVFLADTKNIVLTRVRAVQGNYTSCFHLSLSLLDLKEEATFGTAFRPSHSEASSGPKQWWHSTKLGIFYSTAVV